MRSYTIQDDTEMDVQSFFFQLPMHALYASQEVYANYPPFQREEVWPDRFKFALIKSIVRGAFVPDILVSARTDGKPGEWVLDGQQRLQTLLHFYAALQADMNHQPLPKDKKGHEYFYFRLNERQQKCFMNRMIRFTKLQNMSENMLSDTFLDLQNQVSLTTAEKLWAYPSKMRNVASAVFEHPFYEQIYVGGVTHRQPFQMSIYPTIVEMFKPFADMNAVRLHVLARGHRDDLVYAGIADTINLNMDYVTHIFGGPEATRVQAAAMTEIIIMYQAVWLLNFIGADFGETKAGALAEWYHGVEKLNDEYRTKGFMNLFAQMTQNKVQRQMWGKWLDEIVYGGTIAFKDQNASYAQLQRVTGWLRNNGVCSSCNNVHVQLQDVAKHIFRPADAHTSSLSTCRDSARVQPRQLVEA